MFLGGRGRVHWEKWVNFTLRLNINYNHGHKQLPGIKTVQLGRLLPQNTKSRPTRTTTRPSDAKKGKGKVRYQDRYQEDLIQQD